MNHTKDEMYAAEEGGAGFLSGLLVGGVIGAVAAVLLAPNSGRATREQLREKGYEIRDRIQQATSDLQGQARTVTEDVKEKAQTFVEDAQTMMDQRRDQVSRVADAARETWEKNEPPMNDKKSMP